MILDHISCQSGSRQTFLNPVQAAEFLTEIGLVTAPKTLAKLRCIGGGPPFCKFGRQILYEICALKKWAEGKVSGPFQNTSQTQ